MPVELMTRAELVTYASRSGVTGFADAQYDEAIVRCVDKIRQAALNDYTSASFESLTATTAPDEMRSNAFAIALDELTKADAQRAQTITDAAAHRSRP